MCPKDDQTVNGFATVLVRIGEARGKRRHEQSTRCGPRELRESLSSYLQVLLCRRTLLGASLLTPVQLHRGWSAAAETMERVLHHQRMVGNAVRNFWSKRHLRQSRICNLQVQLIPFLRIRSHPLCKPAHPEMLSVL